MHTTTPTSTWRSLCGLLHSLMLALLLAGPASAGTPPTALPACRPLVDALNSDGTLKAGQRGSFDAQGYTLGTDAATGRPTFRPASTRGTLGAGDEHWQDGFGLQGTGGSILAVARAANGNLYVGGQFGTAGGMAASYVARWNGTSWNALGTGLNGIVRALAVDGSGQVYAGGAFSTAGGVAANNVARWNGTAWSALGTGLNSNVLALAAPGTSRLYVGGGFRTVGDGSKVTANFGIYNNVVPTGTAPAGLAAEVAVYPNPAAQSVSVELPAALRGQAATAELVDALGRVVRAYALPAGQAMHSLPLTDVPAGVYALRLRTAAGRVNRQLVVE
jgi:hypothetical protein